MKSKGFNPLETECDCVTQQYPNISQKPYWYKRPRSLTGFTLIEILMVVAIISLLSSIVIGQLTDAREKGRIAAGQTFSSSLHGAIGDNLVGEWKFDQDNADDTSGWGNDGTLSGGITFVDGVMGRAAEFDGNSYINMGAPNDLNIAGNSITVETWLYGEAALEQWDSIISKSDGNWTRGYGLYYSADGKINFFVKHYNNNKSNITFSLNKWHHVAGVYDGSEVRIFLDGVEGTSDVFSGTIDGDIADPFYVGQGGGGGNRWHGKTDRSEEHTSELQSHSFISYAVFCSKKKM